MRRSRSLSSRGLLDLNALQDRARVEEAQVLFIELLVALGREAEAAAELHQVLQQLLAGTGPRWLFAAATLAGAAVQLGDASACGLLYPILEPSADRMVTPPGAVSWWGSVSYYLGRAAAAAGRSDEAITHLEDAMAVTWRSGPFRGWHTAGLSGLACSTVALGPVTMSEPPAWLLRPWPRPRMLGMTVLCAQLEQAARSQSETWVLELDGVDWLLRAGSEKARLRDSRGLHYLAALLGHPGQEVRALDLAAGGSGLAGIDGGHPRPASQARLSAPVGRARCAA